MVNKNTYGFYVSSNLTDDQIRKNTSITNFSHLHLQMQYLGCLIYTGKKKVVYFNTMVAKTSNKMQGWQGTLLSLKVNMFLSNQFFNPFLFILCLLFIPLKSPQLNLDDHLQYFLGKGESQE
ncbi:hypothetical protein RDI58_017776 [Solanum bulbocastanum]|uniref:Transmembrane protein n=1 Tax=Solanum bulbocastanum TaxID=147425 RepID=A0AAN8TF89_SOLBU